MQAPHEDTGVPFKTEFTTLETSDPMTFCDSDIFKMHRSEGLIPDKDQDYAIISSMWANFISWFEEIRRSYDMKYDHPVAVCNWLEWLRNRLNKDFYDDYSCVTESHIHSLKDYRLKGMMHSPSEYGSWDLEDSDDCDLTDELAHEFESRCCWFHRSLGPIIRCDYDTKDLYLLWGRTVVSYSHIEVVPDFLIEFGPISYFYFLMWWFRELNEKDDKMVIAEDLFWHVIILSTGLAGAIYDRRSLFKKKIKTPVDDDTCD